MLSTGNKVNPFACMAGAFAALVLAFAMAWVGMLAPLDQALQNFRFAATDRAPSGETVFVEIDAESLAAVGVWPWPRQIHARLLDRLMQLGAAEVVYDIDFSTASVPEGDLALEQALERAGGYAFLAAFQQIMADGTVALNVPLERFAAHSEPVLVNVTGDGTDLLRSVPTGLPPAGIKSVAVALVPDAPIADQTIAIDYGIDLTSIARISVAQLLIGNPDPDQFLNKQVVVGASAVELRDFFRVPRFGVIPGPLVQLAAVETLKAGRPLSHRGFAPVLSMAMVAVGLLGLGHRTLSMARLACLSLGGMLLVEASAWLALRDLHISLDTAAFHAFAILMLTTNLLQERASHWRQIFRQQARLAYLAKHDAVTDALSRQALIDQVAMHLQSGAASVCLIQLGGLDNTIAALGHEVGDDVAVQVARRLQAQLGHEPARIANDVFAWSVPEELSTERQTLLCHSVAITLDQPYAVDGHSIILDTRFGSSSGHVGDVSGELLRQAEVALAKARGDNTKSAVYDPDHSERIKQRRLQDIALRQALEQREFFLVYQPQIDLSTGNTVGVEALVRWQSSNLGLVSPAAFIPLAEETGLIVALGEWILNEACSSAAQWSWEGRLSVNVSSVQFRTSDMVATVRAALEKSGFPAHRLDIELTESLFIDIDAAILQTLNELRQMGVGIALDDFGTGYSSLSALSRLPLDIIKIDQSFIRSLPDANNEAIVETIVLMAHRLNKVLIAEGVETPEQRDYLAALGCQVGQGYLFGRPATPLSLGLVPQMTSAA
ncbi:MAG: EAL domain-containing protein [Kaiparowitsia implicata GSE-PSE-MK54-09C]|jgi:EAL domain-containing protein (putative c-di-GMP-specific phosphodiesterase class I)/CHASE2 domain-containing sensor protein|nr:EAL domain-containing protein [Kaiparowitsia implicata GSE-PSE-MK54-09C]